MWRVTTYYFFFGLIRPQHWVYAPTDDLLQRQKFLKENTDTPRWYKVRKDVQYRNCPDRMVCAKCQLRLDDNRSAEDFSIVAGFGDEGLYRHTE